MKEETVIMREFTDISSSYEKYVQNPPSAADIRMPVSDTETFFRQTAADFEQISAENVQLAADVSASYAANVRTPDDGDIYGEMYDSLTERISAAAAGADALTAAAWLSMTEFVGNSCVLAAGEQLDAFGEAVRLLEGVEDPETGYTSRYPAESIRLMEATLTAADADIASFRSRQTVISAVPAFVRSEPDYAEAERKITESIEQLSSLRMRGTDMIAQGREQVLLAEQAKQEGDLRYNQAQAALSNGNYQNARDTLQRAREKYNQSLAMQESASLRTDTDERVASLGAAINRYENEVIVKEVRQLKTEAKTADYHTQLDRAEQLLLQAKTRWATTNVEEDREITSWLSIVGTALSVKSGRTIPVTAPLYPEMSQLLSIANQYYDQGKVLMAQGQKEQATEVLNAAKQKLKEIQLVYPLNQDASLLTLRIDQLIDPVAFQEQFREKFNAARRDYRDPEKQQTAYSDLLDLYAINPGYPGLKDFIYEVELYLGLRLPPPDPAKLAKSRSLTADAKRIVDSNNRASFPIALAQLDEAIELNPGNSEAILLKDRIYTDAGGQAVAVLPSQAEELYQRAVQELQKGNIITASALVEQLLQDSGNRNSSKILDLKKKVDSLL